MANGYFIITLGNSKPAAFTVAVHNGIMGDEIYDNSKPKQKDSIYVQVDTTPEYPGGLEPLMMFLVRNIHYPVMDIQNKKTGKVILSFVVEKRWQFNRY